MSAPLNFIAPVPEQLADSRRLSRFTEQVANALNALIAAGVLIQANAEEWTIDPDALPPSGVTAGSYVFSSITVNAQGLLTAASSGTAYHTIKKDNTPLAQRANLNFVDNFTLADSSPNTDVDLSETGVTPDTYTNATVTVDAHGRITSAASGTASGISPLTTKGDIWAYSTTDARFPVSGNDGYVLSQDSAEPFGLKWIPASGGFTSPLTTKGDILGFSTVDARIPVGANGYLLVPNSGVSLGVEWVKPQLQAFDPRSAIYKPFTPAGDDDEFDDASFSGWTAVSSGSPSLTVTEANDVCSILHPGGDANAQIHAWVKARSISVGDWVEAAFRVATNITANQFPNCGVLFADGNTYNAGAQVLGCWGLQNAGAAAYVMRGHTNFNTAGTTQSVTAPVSHSGTTDIIIRLVYQSANTWQLHFSADGITFVNAITNLSYSMTPTHAGFFCTTWANSNATTKSNFSFRYVRFGP